MLKLKFNTDKLYILNFLITSQTMGILQLQRAIVILHFHVKLSVCKNLDINLSAHDTLLE